MPEQKSIRTAHTHDNVNRDEILIRHTLLERDLPIKILRAG
jgi:hypothetical protein